jgi:hypothetical protein
MENKIDVIEINNSTVIESIAYNHAFELLEVKFINGNTCEYRDVPFEVVKKLKTAKSVGKFFNSHIKNTYEVM